MTTADDTAPDPGPRIAMLTLVDGEPHTITLTADPETADRIARHLDGIPAGQPLRDALSGHRASEDAAPDHPTLTVPDAARLCAFLGVLSPGDPRHDTLNPLHRLLTTTVFTPFYEAGHADVLAGTAVPAPLPEDDLRVTALHFTGAAPHALDLTLAADVADRIAHQLSLAAVIDDRTDDPLSVFPYARPAIDRIAATLADATPDPSGRITVTPTAPDAAQLCWWLGRLPSYDPRQPVLGPLHDVLARTAFRPFHRHSYLDVLTAHASQP